MICLRKVISFNLNICKQIYSLTKEMNVQKWSISKRGRLCAKLVFKRPAESTEVLLFYQRCILFKLFCLILTWNVAKFRGGKFGAPFRLYEYNTLTIKHIGGYVQYPLNSAEKLSSTLKYPIYFVKRFKSRSQQSDFYF